MTEEFQLVRHLHKIDPSQWNNLTQNHPFLQHEFLLALEQTHCAVPDTGWAPQFLLLMRNQQLAGAMPLYLKWHSRGEYVFDYAWARAFEQHGLPYYPKLLSAIPFTPVQGPRLLARNHDDRVKLARQAIALTADNNISSLHVLFPQQSDREALAEAGFLFRDTVQFHWQRQDHQNFDEFLAAMSQKNRKKIRQSRKKIRQAGVTFEWLEGSRISHADLQFFYNCYCQTYLEHGHTPYLSFVFFETLLKMMPQALLLIMAWQNGQRIACALSLRSQSTLYGRYWGAQTFVSGLHFETCYLQAIEYCFSRNLSLFEGGAQGEHKLARGLLPELTPSAHWIADSRYARAISDFVAKETEMIDSYVDHLHEHSPFKGLPTTSDRAAGEPAGSGNDKTSNQ